jgi:hypothetical protein
VDGRDVVREDGVARLMTGHDERCESLQCAIDCWPEWRRRRFSAKKFKTKSISISDACAAVANQFADRA